MCAKTASGRPGMQPERFIWGGESSNAISRRPCPIRIRRWCCIAAAVSGPRWLRITFARWAIRIRFRSMEECGPGRKPGCRSRNSRLPDEDRRQVVIHNRAQAADLEQPDELAEAVVHEFEPR